MYYPRMWKIGLKQPLALAYVLCLYKSNWLYISEEYLDNLESWSLPGDSIATNTRS